MKKLEHLSEIYKLYDTYIIDLWGVMHNGIELHPEAVKVIENLGAKKKRIVFLSNAPRPCKGVIEFLRKMKMDSFILTFQNASFGNEGIGKCSYRWLDFFFASVKHQI